MKKKQGLVEPIVVRIRQLISSRLSSESKKNIKNILSEAPNFRFGVGQMTLIQLVSFLGGFLFFKEIVEHGDIESNLRNLKEENIYELILKGMKYSNNKFMHHQILKYLNELQNKQKKKEFDLRKPLESEKIDSLKSQAHMLTSKVCAALLDIEEIEKETQFCQYILKKPDELKDAKIDFHALQEEVYSDAGRLAHIKNECTIRKLEVLDLENELKIDRIQKEFVIVSEKFEKLNQQLSAFKKYEKIKNSLAQASPRYKREQEKTILAQEAKKEANDNKSETPPVKKKKVKKARPLVSQPPKSASPVKKKEPLALALPSTDSLPELELKQKPQPVIFGDFLMKGFMKNPQLQFEAVIETQVEEKDQFSHLAAILWMCASFANVTYEYIKAKPDNAFLQIYSIALCFIQVRNVIFHDFYQLISPNPPKQPVLTYPEVLAMGQQWKKMRNFPHEFTSEAWQELSENPLFKILIVTKVINRGNKKTAVAALAYLKGHIESEPPKLPHLQFLYPLAMNLLKACRGFYSSSSEEKKEACALRHQNVFSFFDASQSAPAAEPKTLDSADFTM